MVAFDRKSEGTEVSVLSFSEQARRQTATIALYGDFENQNLHLVTGDIFCGERGFLIKYSLKLVCYGDNGVFNTMKNYYFGGRKLLILGAVAIALCKDQRSLATVARLIPSSYFPVVGLSIKT